MLLLASGNTYIVRRMKGILSDLTAAVVTGALLATGDAVGDGSIAGS